MTIFNLPAQELEADESISRLDQLEQWRTAARRVAAAWEQWLACDRTERDWAHDVYADALAREEQAAQRLERHSKVRCEH